MNDLISRQTAIKAVHDAFDECLVWDESGECTANEVERILDELPTIDAVPVVRCRDCVHFAMFKNSVKKVGICKIGYGYCIENDFCSFGERKDEQTL